MRHCALKVHRGCTGSVHFIACTLHFGVALVSSSVHADYACFDNSDINNKELAIIAPLPLLT